MKTSSTGAAKAESINANCKLQAQYAKGQLVGLQVIGGSLPEDTVGDVYAQYLFKHQTVRVGDHFEVTGPNGELLFCEVTRVPSDDRLPKVEISIKWDNKQLPRSTIEARKAVPRSEFADKLLTALASLRGSYELQSWESGAIEEMTNVLTELADQHGTSFDSLLLFAVLGELRNMIPARLRPVADLIRVILSESHPKDVRIELRESNDQPAWNDFRSAESESAPTCKWNPFSVFAQKFFPEN
jgi:hypothetical protein